MGKGHRLTKSGNGSTSISYHQCRNSHWTTSRYSRSSENGEWI
ncbi:unnamed protein product [Strongylus vulgaris]|uniref:Uncharacterized protein n=1 Tax=Strongylus vulgaris TaxID=40348 RepID=A0A3P7IFK9_STRVU|nr:unnamed protein product [Strongylus vulgaris]